MGSQRRGGAGRAEGARQRSGRPHLPPEADPDDLDPEVRRELASLPKGLSDLVAGHLVAAGLALTDDVAAALEHARFARSRASRIAAVREAAGITAYRAGEWNEALRELRAARRLNGGWGQPAVMADCERALGRPERALEIARTQRVTGLPLPLSVELRIVEAGARRDLGQYEAAVLTLQDSDLHDSTGQPWVARLRYAHADNLLAAQRPTDALEWFVSAAEADSTGETDAEQRAAELAEPPESG